MLVDVEKRGEYGEDSGGGTECGVYHREVLQHAVSGEEVGSRRCRSKVGACRDGDDAHVASFQAFGRRSVGHLSQVRTCLYGVLTISYYSSTLRTQHLYLACDSFLR